MDIQKQNQDKPAFIIYDDCLPQKAFKSEIFTNLITQYRHYNITVIIATQYIYKVPPTLREGTTYTAIFLQSTRRSIQAIFIDVNSAGKNRDGIC